MEFKVWHQNTTFYRIIRYLAIVLLPVLLVFYVIKYQEFNDYLIRHYPGHLIPRELWVLLTKFFSYCLHIAINFCLLLAITQRMRYSLWLVYVSFAFLGFGAVLVLLSHLLGFTLSVVVEGTLVKLNKSLILLVLFVAGHFVRKSQKS